MHPQHRSYHLRFGALTSKRQTRWQRESVRQLNAQRRGADLNLVA